MELVSAEVPKLNRKMRDDPYITTVENDSIYVVCDSIHAMNNYPELEFWIVPDDSVMLYGSRLKPMLNF